MKKWTYHHMFLLLIGVNLLLIVAAGVLSRLDIVLFLHGFTDRELEFICGCAVCALMLIWFTAWRCRATDRTWKKAVKILALLLALLICGTFALGAYAFSSVPGEFHSFTSPDGQHSIVVERRSYFAVEWGTVYEMTSPITMKKIGQIRGGFFPESMEIIWHETYLELIIGTENLCFPYLNA